MKKLLLALLILSVAFLTYGCTQSTSTTATAAPAATAQGMATYASVYASGIGSSMAGWASSGTVGGMGVSAASVRNKTVTGPTNGWYHIVENDTAAGLTYDYDVYVKLTESGGLVTGVDVYGTSAVSYTTSGSTYTYNITYGNGASAPYHGAVTGTVGNLLLTLSGAFGFSASYPSGAGTTDTFSFTYAFTNFSLPITTGASDYPSGTITVSWTMNGVTEPAITLVYSGSSTATCSYNGTTSNITVYPSSVD